MCLMEPRGGCRTVVALIDYAHNKLQRCVLPDTSIRTIIQPYREPANMSHRPRGTTKSFWRGDRSCWPDRPVCHLRQVRHCQPTGNQRVLNPSLWPLLRCEKTPGQWKSVLIPHSWRYLMSKVRSRAPRSIGLEPNPAPAGGGRTTDGRIPTWGAGSHPIAPMNHGNRQEPPGPWHWSGP